MDIVYTIDCSECGVVTNNQSPIYCDKCGSSIDRIKLGGFWYDVDELDRDNVYNLEE